MGCGGVSEEEPGSAEGTWTSGGIRETGGEQWGTDISKVDILIM